MTRVKICGIRRIEDAYLASYAGADAIGVLVGQHHASDDFIDAEQARLIVEKLPPFCSSVLVTHLAQAGAVIELARSVRVATVQLHGETSAMDAGWIRRNLGNVKVIKAIHVTDESAIAEAASYEDWVDAILLDTANRATGQVGGTGLTHDWRISRRIVEDSKVPVILAGGLHAGNVAEAIRAVRPYAVDANSGTKGADGFKDPLKLAAFIKAAKDA